MVNTLGINWDVLGPAILISLPFVLTLINLVIQNLGESKPKKKR